MLPNDLIAFIIEEAQHRVINDKCTKMAKLVLAACTKKFEEPRGKDRNKGKNTQSDTKCNNCNGSGHSKWDCWTKGGDKEGEGPRQRKKKGKQTETTVVAVNNDENKLFTFTCTLDCAVVIDKLNLSKLRLGTCVDSGASYDYCPDHSKFTNYKAIKQDITIANGKSLKAVGMRDLHLELPNGSKKTKVISKNTIHTPNMAFTFISISILDRAGYSATFCNRMCTIKNPNSQTVATIPHSDGLYKIAASKPFGNSECSIWKDVNQ